MIDDEIEKGKDTPIFNTFLTLVNAWFLNINRVPGISFDGGFKNFQYRTLVDKKNVIDAMIETLQRCKENIIWKDSQEQLLTAANRPKSNL